ncbi:MAG TPA: N,N-dimethylformamidase beta subunit family domain-containing protein, partial [Thermoanaerobaculia bacterium]|nr:N,N-dimethylformamidase beta subunit family domain-containing protein [Thermoanaerobaculia bacterium]
ARTGTDRWQTRNSPTLDIAGYASATSAAAGETLRFYVTSSADPAFTIEIFRMGWYGGLGGRRMTDAVEVTGGAQDACPPDAERGLIRCNWRESYAITIPNDWVSGFYLAKLTGSPSGNQNHILFVVRDGRRAPLVFQSMVTTYQAYNNWGGKSLYPSNSTGPPAKAVSFDRPYSTGTGAGQFLLAWEYPMVRFLEREGYDVTYITNIDTHARPELLRRGTAFLSVGHDEYWSWEMRENVEAARDAGVHLGFFSANTCYWQIRYEDNLRTMVSHKETALSTDPILQDGNPLNDHLTTTLWRNVPVNSPEELLIGVMYVQSPIDGDIVIDNPDHWVFANTGLKKGDVLKGLLGYEVDAIVGRASPPGLIRLAHSPFVSADNETGTSDMTIYTARSGAIVFATGTIQWSWGLDEYGPRSRGNRTSAAAQQITRNVLNRMSAGPSGPRRRSVRP